MSKEQSRDKAKESSKKKQNTETADFFQLLQNNGMFVDYASPVKEAIGEIEKQLK